MKKIILTSLCLCGISGALVAQSPMGGFVENPQNSLTTVAEAEKMKDDSYVTLKGQIEKRIKKDKYLFKDGTGTIIVEIDDEDWNGLTVNPQDTIEIMGEVDKDWKKTKIDVKKVVKVNQ